MNFAAYHPDLLDVCILAFVIIAASVFVFCCFWVAAEKVDT